MPGKHEGNPVTAPVPLVANGLARPFHGLAYPPPPRNPGHRRTGRHSRPKPPWWPDGILAHSCLSIARPIFNSEIPVSRGHGSFYEWRRPRLQRTSYVRIGRGIRSGRCCTMSVTVVFWFGNEPRRVDELRLVRFETRSLQQFPQVGKTLISFRGRCDVAIPIDHDIRRYRTDLIGARNLIFRCQHD